MRHRPSVLLITIFLMSCSRSYTPAEMPEIDPWNVFVERGLQTYDAEDSAGRVWQINLVRFVEKANFFEYKSRSTRFVCTFLRGTCESYRGSPHWSPSDDKFFVTWESFGGLYELNSARLFQIVDWTEAGPVPIRLKFERRKFGDMVPTAWRTDNCLELRPREGNSETVYLAYLEAGDWRIAPAANSEIAACTSRHDGNL